MLLSRHLVSPNFIIAALPILDAAMALSLLLPSTQLSSGRNGTAYRTQQMDNLYLQI